MNRSQSVKAMLLAVFLCMCGAVIACGSGIEGTYANDTMGIVVELKSGGQATFTSSLGDNDACTYKVDGKKLTLDCKHDKVVFTIHDDGSLNAPFFRHAAKIKAVRRKSFAAHSILHRGIVSTDRSKVRSQCCNRF